MRSLRELVLGSPLPTGRLAMERLDKVRALAVFSPDALSSIAYANQEIYLGLAVAGAAGLRYSFPIALAITGLLLVLALSYFQTIHAYPGGGGSYTVARENLGAGFGLVAAAALLVDYLLTAAVSLTAGVAAMASAFPALWPYRTGLALLLLLIITLANLRGVRETGTLMAVPVYFFLASYLAMLAVGVVRALLEGPVSFASTAPPPAQPVSAFLILHTFAAGCTALTGIEAISNGVPAFRPPQSRNAGITLLVMALLMGTLFLGSIGLTQYFGVVAGPGETILSALAHRLFGSGWPYFLVQSALLLVLAIAANTSYADFPRLASILARDGYLPRQLSQLGDRLVFSNGIVLLGGLAGLLIILFGGDTHALIPLFAVGVFLAFTLSQAGMVVHWIRWRGPGWLPKAML
ncbi:MAG: APC family permease, partial [Chloroflexia bacterium]